ncbi:hypothetical protein [Nocardioides zhouii]|uniref:Uncharacterized protein n=1 Tax=Nocardioides zhouii TaxID=1168729 RepID=A0A4Q2T7D0_9ACTN|nr:hypothetical protein [Nocardioides zhouii]RYC14672.1 hypothetical protein EUA94_00690 [Nocardioides zhouii]
MVMTVPPAILQPFLAAADAAAAVRPEVDGDLARELMGEAAAMLHNSLALDHLDEHDLGVAVATLATALVAPDPTEAVRACAAAPSAAGLHDPEGVRAAYLVTVQVLGL